MASLSGSELFLHNEIDLSGIPSTIVVTFRYNDDGTTHNIAGTANNFLQVNSGGSVTVITFNQTLDFIASAGDTLPPNTWVTLAMRKEPSDYISIYYSTQYGESIGDVENISSDTEFKTTGVAGVPGAPSGDQLDGDIAYAGVWDRVLSNGEIKYLANMTSENVSII